MKRYTKVIWVMILSLSLEFLPALNSTAQQGSNSNEKLTSPRAESSAAQTEREKLNAEIEKTIENEKFMEMEHAELHDNDMVTRDDQFPKEKNFITVGSGQIKTEETKRKLQVANTNMRHAEAALIRAEESIAEAKETLLIAKKNSTLTEEEIKLKQKNIEKAEEVLNEAREKFKNDLININSKFQQVNNHQ